MSQEKVLKTLEDLGFTQSDARVYIFLAKRGPLKASALAKSLKIRRQTLYFTIKNLQKKGLITSTLQRPARFSVVPFEKVLDLFVKAKLEEAQRMQLNKTELLSDWQSIALPETEEASAKFAVIEGRSNIYSKIQQMLEETEKQVDFITSVTGLIRADEFGLFDTALRLASRSKTKFRFLTELSEKNVSNIKVLFTKKLKNKLNIEGRTPDLGLRLFPRMVIRDEAEALFFIATETDPSSVPKQDSLCLWTNCKSLVQAFYGIFEELWHNSIDIQKKIVEMETGKPTTKICIISDVEIARKKFEEVVHSAKQEIVAVTSAEGLVKFWKKLIPIEDLVGRRVSTRIMAPITSDNLPVAQEMSKCCEVRHVSPGYLETTIVDGKHLFQIKKQSLDGEPRGDSPNFENTFYTTDPEYIEKTGNMLNSIWENARAPSILKIGFKSDLSVPRISPVTDEEYAFSKSDSPYRKMTTFIEEKPGIMPEEVLEKIINAKKYPAKNWPKEIIRQYGSGASAVIHPPKHFNLPDMMMIFVRHYNKQSSYGAEDHLIVYTSMGYAYAPAAFVTDNPRGLEIRNTVYAGTPIDHNIQLVKRDQLQVRVHGNTVFAGWSIPIPLYPGPYLLPPSCILVEGYGKLKTGELRFEMPSGVKITHAYNGYDAFVTFFHPTSKYAGPGTDGTISRDLITTTHPPSTA